MSLFLSKAVVILRGRSETRNQHSGELKARIFSFLLTGLLSCYPCDFSHPLSYQYLFLWHYKSFRTSCPIPDFLPPPFPVPPPPRPPHSHFGTKHKIFLNGIFLPNTSMLCLHFLVPDILPNSVEEMSSLSPQHARC